MSAIESAQPRPRSHVASSTSRAARKTLLASAGSTHQAGIRSQAGSPTPRQPKSMTALSRPSTHNRFPASRSPWIQIGGPSQASACSALSHAAATAAVSTIPCSCSIAVRVGASRRSSGTPRPAGGPSFGSICCNAAMNCATSVASEPASSDVADIRVLAVQPDLHRPVPGIALGRLALCEHGGYRDRQERSEHRQPPLLEVDLAGRPLDARQPHGHVLAEPVDRIVGPARGDRLDRKGRPLRELRREQASDERRVRVDLVRVHLGG